MHGLPDNPNTAKRLENLWNLHLHWRSERSADVRMYARVCTRPSKLQATAVARRTEDVRRARQLKHMSLTSKREVKCFAKTRTSSQDASRTNPKGVQQKRKLEFVPVTRVTPTGGGKGARRKDASQSAISAQVYRRTKSPG